MEAHFSHSDSRVLSLSGIHSEDTQHATIRAAMEAVEGHAALAKLAPALDSAAALLKGIPGQQGKSHKAPGVFPPSTVCSENQAMHSSLLRAVL